MRYFLIIREVYISCYIRKYWKWLEVNSRIVFFFKGWIIIILWFKDIFRVLEGVCIGDIEIKVLDGIKLVSLWNGI